MIYNKLILALALSAGMLNGADAQNARKGGARGGRGGATTTSSSVAAVSSAATSAAASAAATGAASNTTTSDASTSDLQLTADNVQVASQTDGQANAAAGQSPSDTDPANFINFCTGKTITNGLQVKGGSCNGIVMGDIPSNTNMISSIITNPGPGDDITANTDFTIDVKVLNLVAGSFTNPDTTYYGAPQELSGGKIVGHTHVTVQSIGTLDTPTPPDPATFAFFKGINDAGDGNGGLSAAVAGGLPAGVYRVCTMTSSSNHQPVLMPVAQRGAQDDCQKFTVGGSGASTGGGGSASNGTASAVASSAADTASTTTAAASSSAAASSTTAAAATTTSAAAAGGRGGRGRGGRVRFAVRE